MKNGQPRRLFASQSKLPSKLPSRLTDSVNGSLKPERLLTLNVNEIS